MTCGGPVQSDGELKPGSKGLALTPGQFTSIRQAEPAISAALAAGDTNFELPLSERCGAATMLWSWRLSACSAGVHCMWLIWNNCSLSLSAKLILLSQSQYGVDAQAQAVHQHVRGQAARRHAVRPSVCMP